MKPAGEGILIFLPILLMSSMLIAPCFAQVDVKYTPSGTMIRNPERGFYTELTSEAERGLLTPQELAMCKAKGQTLIMRMYYLSSFRSLPLSDVELNIVKNDFQVIRAAGMKCIPRFAYSHNIGQQDAPLNIVMGHIAQLKPIIRANADVIAAMQAGFIGAWGEMHSSTNGLDSVTNMRKILFEILKMLPPERMVQVRTPHYKREIFNRQAPIAKSEAFNESMYSRVGHHNDCFLANWDDYGTYTDTTEETAFLSEECRYVPMGGETCNPSSFAECANTIKQMEKLHWSFLNSGYHPGVLKGWRGENCFDVITKRLGYRFELLSGRFDDALRPGNGFHYAIRLTNTGFAALFNPRDVELVIEHRASKARWAVKLPDDPRFWEPGDTLSLAGEAGLPDDMPGGACSVYLNLPDPESRLHFRPDYAVQFANDNTWVQESGYNDLKFTLNVRTGYAGKMYTGLYYFQPLTVPAETDTPNSEGNQ